MEYIPNSVLLNHIYFPFHTEPVYKTYDCLKDFTQLEIGTNGILSVIPLTTKVNGEDEQVIPFIDMSKYDIETKQWFWYDSNRFPLRINRYGDGKALTSIYNFGKYYGYWIEYDPNTILNGGESGFYSNVTSEDFSSDRVYLGSPIILTIDDYVINDKTVYGNTDVNPNLTKLNIETNKEFYFDPDTNKIYTNQNLAGVDPANIKLYFSTIPNELSVKCRLKSNVGDDSYTTPTVDYYVVKLNGQYMRG